LPPHKFSRPQSSEPMHVKGLETDKVSRKQFSKKSTTGAEKKFSQLSLEKYDPGSTKSVQKKKQNNQF